MVAPKLTCITDGAFVLPVIFDPTQVRDIIASIEIQCHHQDEDTGHNGYDPRLDEEEEEKKEEEKEKKDPPNKGQPKSHSRPDKSSYLPKVAQQMWPHVSHVQLGGLHAYAVDPFMKLYRIPPGGNVAPHVDEDFMAMDESTALCSILIYLNDGYTGGETIFNSATIAKGIKVGGGMLFRHDLLHRGNAVLTGERYVLKTDLLFHAS